MQNGRGNRNGVSEQFRDAVFAVFYAEAFVLAPSHSFTPLNPPLTPPSLLQIPYIIGRNDGQSGEHAQEDEQRGGGDVDRMQGNAALAVENAEDGQKLLPTMREEEESQARREADGPPKPTLPGSESRGGQTTHDALGKSVVGNLLPVLVEKTQEQIVIFFGHIHSVLNKWPFFLSRGRGATSPCPAPYP